MPALSPLRAAEPDRMAAIRARLAQTPDGVLETVARELGVPLWLVLEALPDEARLFIAPERFETLWQVLSGWGEVLLIVHTEDIVLECRGVLPPGTFGRGYFNIHGEGPIGGHIRAQNCRAIYLVDRPFHGRRSCSVQFFNTAGEAMFKVFVPRGPDRALLAEPLRRFEALWSELAAARDATPR